ncbi:hypothetical protein CRE_22052 [Caenorhabditis remanei]|uniref:F-box domain-containing protein n=1 Tax=Caenorhabditis remanei TaxID=31234 RepID=E3N3J9_CAERE|nr:hypothetical protein CRE_22052 [Caenorhabditis remanei]
MNPFPLLRLPGVVMCNVFKSLSIGEKIKLSFCSKKTLAQINNARLYSQKVDVELNCLRQKIRVYSENNKEPFEISIYQDSWKRHNSKTHQCSIAYCSVGVIFFSKGVQTLWKNHQEGYISIIKHLSKMFQCNISTKSSCYASDLFQPTISKLFDRQLEFKTITIKLDGSENQKLLWNQISNKFGLVEDLRISFVTDLGFRPVFTSWPQKIYIWRSYWFNLESVLTCTCSRITLELSNLGNKDLDEILKNWKAGRFPNLELLDIYSDNIKTTGTTILGMNLEELNRKVIRTDDESKKANIRIGTGFMGMSVTPFQ